MTHSHIARKRKLSHDILTYNKEENKDITPSHIIRKKMKP
jgi:hypothetical protein